MNLFFFLFYQILRFSPNLIRSICGYWYYHFLFFDLLNLFLLFLNLICQTLHTMLIDFVPCFTDNFFCKNDPMESTFLQNLWLVIQQTTEFLLQVINFFSSCFKLLTWLTSDLYSELVWLDNFLCYLCQWRLHTFNQDIPLFFEKLNRFELSFTKVKSITFLMDFYKLDKQLHFYFISLLILLRFTFEYFVEGEQGPTSSVLLKIY